MIILNYGKEAENECFAQGLVGKDKKMRRKDSEVKIPWVAFRGELLYGGEWQMKFVVGQEYICKKAKSFLAQSRGYC